MDQAVDWWQYMVPILEVDSITTMTGTPYHYSDLYAKIRRERQFRQIFVRGCRHKGLPIYSTWFSEADLKRLEKRMGPYKFQCQFECNPEPIELKPFPPPQPQYDQLPDDEKGYKFYCLIDPAATTEAYSDKTAFTIAAVNHIKQVFVIKSFGIKRKGDVTADKLIELHLMYHFDKVGIELGLQEHLRVIIDLKCKEWERINNRKLDLFGRITPVPIKKINKGFRIMDALGPLVRLGKLLIHHKNYELLKQMDRFTGQESDDDDLIDSLSMIVHVVPSFAAHRSMPEQFKRAGWTVKEFMKRHSQKKKGWEARFKN